MDLISAPVGEISQSDRRDGVLMAKLTRSQDIVEMRDGRC